MIQEATKIREAMIGALSHHRDYCCPLERLPYGKWSDGLVVAANLCIGGVVVMYPNGEIGLAERVPADFTVRVEAALHVAEVSPCASN